MMKLRLRSKDSEETIEIEVSDDCTLKILKQTIRQTLHTTLPRTRLYSDDSLRISLIREHELRDSSPADSLRSLGITSGDLLSFTFDRAYFSNSRVHAEQIWQFQQKNCSRSIFLQRVTTEGLGRNAREFFVITVHSVLLESGFAPIDLIEMPEDWNSTPFLMSIRYAVRRLNTMDEVILLKFQSFERSILVYGFVSCIRESKVYRVSLDETTFSLNLDSIADGTEAKSIERKVLEFWKTVEDSLALPLLIDLERTNMLHPPRFFLLPNDLKLTIMEALSGVDIAKLQCVCTELKSFTSNDDLWKVTFKKEFPWAFDYAQTRWDWKGNFVRFYNY